MNDCGGGCPLPSLAPAGLSSSLRVSGRPLVSHPGPIFSSSFICVNGQDLGDIQGGQRWVYSCEYAQQFTLGFLVFNYVLFSKQTL